MSHRSRGRSRGRGRGKSQAQRLEALRSSTKERINDICADRGEWVNICRRTLLDMETRNIHRRAKHWTELVNEKVKDTNSRLNLDSQIFNKITKKFEYTVDNDAMNKHLGFIISWRGLKTRQIQNVPKTYLEFENKAKNWLNGRRAPNYAVTLFPEMIKKCEIYAEMVSRQIFPNNPSHSKMYCKICIIGFLSSLCSARISLNDASKKAYLICENSVKTGKTQVSQILQRYAEDHPYKDKFPSHLREASDFFEKKYMELISDFGIQLNQKKRQEKLEYAKNTGGCVFDIINQSNDPNGSQSDSNNSVHSGSASLTNNGIENGLPSSVTHSIMKDIINCDGNLNAISMSIDQFNKLAQFLSGMISNQKTQQGTINDLVTRVHQLETQQQKILNDVTTNSHSPTSTDTPQSDPQYTGSNNTDNSNSNNNPNGNGMQHYQGVVPMPPTVQRQQQQRFILPNNGMISPTNSHNTKTTDSTHSQAQTNTYRINPMQPIQQIQQIQHIQRMNNIQNMNIHPQHVHMANMRHTCMNVNRMNRMNVNNNNVIGVPVPQMNHVSNITNLPVPQITNINMNRLQNNNNNNNNQNNNINNQLQYNNNNNLPTTSLFGGVGGATSFDSNDGDANMFNFGNNQSFNSSDAGMTNINNISNSNHLIPLDAGFGIPRFSDQSLNLQNIGQYNQ